MTNTDHLSTNNRRKPFRKCTMRFSLENKNKTHVASHFMSQIRILARLFNISWMNSFWGPSTQTIIVPETSAVVNFPKRSFQAKLEIPLLCPSKVWFLVNWAWPARPRIRASPAKLVKIHRISCWLSLNQLTFWHIQFKYFYETICTTSWYITINSIPSTFGDRGFARHSNSFSEMNKHLQFRSEQDVKDEDVLILMNQPWEYRIIVR